MDLDGHSRSSRCSVHIWFVAFRVGYRWIYWILAATNGVQLGLYTFFGLETKYIRKTSRQDSPGFRKEYFAFRQIDPSPIRISDFVNPLLYASKIYILLPAIAYSIVFGFAIVMITVEIPQLFGEKFGLNTQQLGLQFLGPMIGSVVGEQIGGYASDNWMSRRTHKQGGIRPQPEFRLWLSYGGYLVSIVGVIVFLVQIGNAREMHWNVSPIIGAEIAGAGNQIVTTVVITYAVDCHTEDAAGVGVFITFVRQMWGFIGPFW